MMVSFCKQLTAIILLMTVLFAPLTSIAHDLKSGVMKEACACQMLQDDCPHDGRGQSDECPCDGSGDCCAYEECCHDSLEQAHASGLNIHPSPIKLFHSDPARTFPKVYLAIFVPPES
jgi:hypothetical protein